MIEIIILSFIQGVAEFIPVSSSSHLILMSNLLNFENQSLSIDISLHIGSLLAVLVYFYKDIISFVENKVLFFKIFISSLPVMIVGFLLVETGIIDQIRNIKIIAWTTLIFGFLLYFSDKFKLEKSKSILACITTNEDKVSILVGLTNDLIDTYDARVLIKSTFDILGSKGGGGRIDFAQAGGNKKDQLNQAFLSIKNQI